MLRVARLAIGLVMVTLLTEAALATASAQGIVPAPPYYAASPATGGQSPVQQQIQENYRFQLLQTQREMLQQNPSGLGRDQIEVNRQLNTYSAPSPAPVYAVPPPARNPAPPAAYYSAPPVDHVPAYDTPAYDTPPAHRHVARHPVQRHPAPDAAPSR
jgi:hypothetical protein